MSDPANTVLPSNNGSKWGRKMLSDRNFFYYDMHLQHLTCIKHILQPVACRGIAIIAYNLDF
jgi:hypothetical protein